MKVIPAIDLLDGQCVRLIQGDYSRRTVYAPVFEVVDQLNEHGVDRLHVVDLDAAKSGELQNIEVIGAIAERFGGEIQVGGGIRSLGAAERYRGMGARWIVVGSAVVTEPALFGALVDASPDGVIAALDYRRVDGERIVATHGWIESSGRPLLDVVAEVIATGCRTVLATDVSKDGTFEGPDVATYRELIEQFDLALIASGGVGSITDLEELAALEERGGGLFGAVVGRALHDGRLDLGEVTARWSR
jgi:phosphoribosylformimino-5-aminoimidazole carboxamide ribotide isomerase